MEIEALGSPLEAAMLGKHFGLLLRACYQVFVRELQDPLWV